MFHLAQKFAWDGMSPNDCFEIVDAIQSAGANELTRCTLGPKQADEVSEIKWSYINEIRQRFDILSSQMVKYGIIKTGKLALKPHRC